MILHFRYIHTSEIMFLPIFLLSLKILLIESGFYGANIKNNVGSLSLSLENNISILVQSATYYGTHQTWNNKFYYLNS